jgi:hypothetical protein
MTSSGGSDTSAEPVAERGESPGAKREIWSMVEMAGELESERAEAAAPSCEE